PYTPSLITVSLLSRSVDLPPLPSFPTRRSSDLAGLTVGDVTDVSDSTRPNGRVDRTEPASGDVVDPDDPRVELKVSTRVDVPNLDRKSTRLNSSHVSISYAVFCLKKKNHSSTPF